MKKNKVFLTLFFTLSILIITTQVNAISIISGSPDHPPHANLFTRTGNKRVDISANVQDDRFVKSFKLYVNNSLVLLIEDLGSKFHLKYKTKLNDPFTETWLPIKNGKAHDATLTLIRDTSSGYKLSIKGYYLILKTGDYILKSECMDNANQKSESAVLVKITKDNPPQINILSPSNNAKYHVRGYSKRISFKANVKDDFGVKKVEFYLNGRLIRTFSSGGTCTYTKNVKVGKYNFKVTAFDRIGSSSKTVTFEIIHDNPPNGIITYPSNGQTIYTACNSPRITIKGRVSDDFGVTKVEIYEGNKLLGRANVKGNEFFLSKSFSIGTHTIKARIYDILGSVYTSPVTFKVSKISVQIISPKNGQVIPTKGSSARVSIKAIVNGKASKVAFYELKNNIPIKLGEDTNAPYEITINLSLGKHILFARAYNGCFVDSNPITITVVRITPPKILKVYAPQIGWSSNLNGIPTVGR